MTDEQTAAAIVADPMNSVSETAMEAAIVRALQAAYSNGYTNGHTVGINHEANREVLRMCHAASMMNGIVDYSHPNSVGVVRRVLGTFKLTDDGCAIGSAFAAVWCLHAKTKKAYQTTLYAAGHFRKMWSTREAAEKAKEAKK